MLGHEFHKATNTFTFTCFVFFGFFYLCIGVLLRARSIFHECRDHIHTNTRIHTLKLLSNHNLICCPLSTGDKGLAQGHHRGGNEGGVSAAFHFPHTDL